MLLSVKICVDCGEILGKKAVDEFGVTDLCAMIMSYKLNSGVCFIWLFIYIAAEKELHVQIASLPIRSDTLTLRTKKQDLDRKLRDVEGAIKIFSRRKVYVKDD